MALTFPNLAMNIFIIEAILHKCLLYKFNAFYMLCCRQDFAC